MWYVWWRYNTGSNTSAWADVPRQYKTEKAARMAERDQNSESTRHGYRLEYRALPEGVHPNTLGEDHGTTRT